MLPTACASMLRMWAQRTKIVVSIQPLLSVDARTVGATGLSSYHLFTLAAAMYMKLCHVYTLHLVLFLS